MGDHTLVITEKGENYFRLDSISYEDGSSQVQSSSNKVPVSSTTPATPPQPVQSSVLIKTSTLLLTETMTDTTVIQETTQPAFSEGLPQNLVGSSSSDGSPTTLLEPYAQSSHSGSAGASASSAPLITTYIGMKVISFPLCICLNFLLRWGQNGHPGTSSNNSDRNNRWNCRRNIQRLPTGRSFCFSGASGDVYGCSGRNSSRTIRYPHRIYFAALPPTSKFYKSQQNLSGMSFRRNELALVQQW